MMNQKISYPLPALVVLAVVCSLSMGQVAEAQIPNGCGTPEVPGWLANGLDAIFLGACDRHDNCWGECNGPYPPYLGVGHKLGCDLAFLAEMEAACLSYSAILTYPVGEADNAAEFRDICEEVAASFYAIVSANFFSFWNSQCTNGCNADACGGTPPPPCGYGRCYFNPPVCECFTRFQCEVMYGILNPGRWVCTACQCQEAPSPLVIHLPDYFSSGGGSQNWWKQDFCTSEAPTVCLDWSGDGNVTCTGWTAPESEIAFVVALSHDDGLRLAEGVPVPAEPWRHFFGNVTVGPEGSFPFAHGFEALAAHCGLEPEATSEIDLTECGLSLHVWGDHNADGDIDLDELLEFRDLGVESLGDLRQTGKRDACGNTFPVESHATCTGHPGKCGTWLDVFFELR